MSNLTDIEKQINLGGELGRIWKENDDLKHENEAIKKQRGKMSEIISRYKAKYGELDE